MTPIILNQIGGDEISAFKSLDGAVQKLAEQGAIKNVFQTVVKVKGFDVTVRGKVLSDIYSGRSSFRIIGQPPRGPYEPLCRGNPLRKPLTKNPKT